MTDTTLWDQKALAEFLGYSPRTIRRMATTHPERLPPRVAGLGRQRWSPEVVRAWVNEQSARPTTPKRGRPRQAA